MEGLIDRLLSDDPFAARCLDRYCVVFLPIANPDGVVRGRTRFNLRGMDLNRNWGRPANPDLAPENAALEKWVEAWIAGLNDYPSAENWKTYGEQLAVVFHEFFGGE